jgi:hypothetical protein
MERNEESLSTRDLAPNDPPARTVADDDAGVGAQETEAPERAPGQAADRDPAPASPGRNDLGAAGSERGFERESPTLEGRSGPAPASAHSETVATQSPATVAAAHAPDDQRGDDQPLLDAQLSTDFQLRWEEVQTRFVDEPRGAVEDADGLVAHVMQQLAEGFAQERERLEAQWGRGEDISTEDLRVALQRYRSFFRRLLST